MELDIKRKKLKKKYHNNKKKIPNHNAPGFLSKKKFPLNGGIEELQKNERRIVVPPTMENNRKGTIPQKLFNPTMAILNLINSEFPNSHNWRLAGFSEKTGESRCHRKGSEWFQSYTKYQRFTERYSGPRKLLLCWT